MPILITSVLFTSFLLSTCPSLLCGCDTSQFLFLVAVGSQFLKKNINSFHLTYLVCISFWRSNVMDVSLGNIVSMEYFLSLIVTSCVHDHHAAGSGAGREWREKPSRYHDFSPLQGASELPVGNLPQTSTPTPALSLSWKLGLFGHSVSQNNHCVRASTEKRSHRPKSQS